MKQENRRFKTVRITLPPDVNFWCGSMTISSKVITFHLKYIYHLLLSKSFNFLQKETTNVVYEMWDREQKIERTQFGQYLLLTQIVLQWKKHNFFHGFKRKLNRSRFRVKIVRGVALLIGFCTHFSIKTITIWNLGLHYLRKDEHG